jgi:hypothetical protein
MKTCGVQYHINCDIYPNQKALFCVYLSYKHNISNINPHSHLSVKPAEGLEVFEPVGFLHRIRPVHTLPQTLQYLITLRHTPHRSALTRLVAIKYHWKEVIANISFELLCHAVPCPLLWLQYTPLTSLYDLRYTDTSAHIAYHSIITKS